MYKKESCLSFALYESIVVDPFCMRSNFRSLQMKIIFYAVNTEHRAQIEYGRHCYMYAVATDLQPVQL